MNEDINSNQHFLDCVIQKKEPETTIFYESYDRLIWDLSRKWYPAISTLSKNQMEQEDIHNELWIHVFKNIKKCDLNKSGITTWLYLVCTSKLGMIKRSLEAKKNNIVANEINYSFSIMISNFEENGIELSGLIYDKHSEGIDEITIIKEKVLDFIYLILDLFDGCTDRERKIYLLKIKGKTQNEIAEEANVSKSYIPKAFKKMGIKLKKMFDSIDEGQYIDKKERDAIAKDLLNKKSESYISKKYDIDLETVRICGEMLDIIGIRD